MSRPDIALLLLDVHGVLLNRPLLSVFGRLARHTGQPVDTVWQRWRRELRDAAWRGEIDDEELWRRLAGTDRVEPGWVRMLDRLSARGRGAARVPDWRQRVPVWLLSNHRTHWLVPRLERFDLMRHVDRVLVSDRIGAVKPESAAFAPALEHVADPGEILFVDDQSKNVAVARRLGLSTVLAAGHDWVAAVDEALAPRRSPVGG